MDKIEIEERKKLQLDILDAIHACCIENNINYSLGYGTLLGAVRHGGYIPWDDDIDIVMLRCDYDEFLKKFSHSRYKVAADSTTKNWFLPYAKIYDNSTIIIDRKANTPAIGVNVDVFPIDDAMASEKEYLKQRRRMAFLITCNRIKLFKLNKESSMYNNLLGAIAKLALCVFPRYYFVKKIIRASKKYNGKGFRKAVYWPSVDKVKYLNKSVYETIIDIQFENRIYKAIKDYDLYLSTIYGDYMTLPPKESRISYHTSDAYWK